MIWSKYDLKQTYKIKTYDIKNNIISHIFNNDIKETKLTDAEEYTNVNMMYEVRTDTLNINNKILDNLDEIKLNKNKIVKSILEKFGKLQKYIIYDYEYGAIQTFNFKTKKLSYDYNGSYYLNITLPHNQNIDLMQFQSEHINLMKCIQLIEPLLLGVYSHVHQMSYNDNHKNLESSSRLLGSDYFNFLNISDVSRLYTKVFRQKS